MSDRYGQHTPSPAPQTADELAEKLRLVEDLAGVGHWRFCLRSRTVEWSPEVFRIHGVDPNSFNPNYDDVVAAYHPDDRETLQRFVARAEATGEGYAFKLRLNRLSDGAERIVMARAAVIKDETDAPQTLFGVFRDVTERETMLARLKENEALYRLLADHATDIIVRAGPNGVIRYASPSCRLFGLSPEEAVGRSTLEFVIDEDKDYARWVTGELFSGRDPDRSVRREYRVRAADGAIRWVEGNPSLVRDESGEPVEFITAFRDVTARRALEDELQRARETAETALKVKADFLANVSHELRTPLTSVIGFARALSQRGDVPTDARRNARQILDAGASLLSMVNDLLDIAALDARGLQLKPGPFLVREATQDVIDLVAEQAAAKGLELELVIEDGVEDSVVGDAFRVKQVLLNFLSNAVKFTSVGGVRLGIERIPAGNVLRFTVADTGPGVPLGLRATLFERFSRGASKSSGTGLGLAICKELADLMGGAVGVDENLIGGAIFWFAVPLPRVDAAASRAIAEGRAASLASRRVLLVEDHENIQEIVRQILTPLGHEVDVAGDGASGLLAVVNNRYDVILVDGNLPDTTGASLTRAIRSLGGSAAATPIIALSAFTRADALPIFLEAGADGYLAKPIDVRELVAAIRNPPLRPRASN